MMGASVKNDISELAAWRTHVEHPEVSLHGVRLFSVRIMNYMVLYITMLLDSAATCETSCSYLRLGTTTKICGGNIFWEWLRV